MISWHRVDQRVTTNDDGRPWHNADGTRFDGATPVSGAVYVVTSVGHSSRIQRVSGCSGVAFTLRGFGGILFAVEFFRPVDPLAELREFAARRPKITAQPKPELERA